MNRSRMHLDARRRARWLVASLAAALGLTAGLAQPRLTIQQPSSDQVTLTWDSGIGFRLEQAGLLQEPVAWRPATERPTRAGERFSLTLPASGTQRYFRLASWLTRIDAISPARGETGVSVNREVIVTLSEPLEATTLVTTANFSAGFGGRRLLARVELSSDRQKVTLFYLEPLPSNARINVVFDATGVRDTRGQEVDADGDGQAGGIATFHYDTLTTTPVMNTAVLGRVFASDPVPDPLEPGKFLNRPLKGVTITVDGREQDLRAVTDAEGRFKLEPSPSGRFFVHIDGRTAEGSAWPGGAYYPFVGKAWEAEAGRGDNLAGGTGEVFLPLVKEGTLQPVSSVQETIISFPPAVVAANPALAGVNVSVPPGALFADDGARGGRVGIAPVPPDRLPGPLPTGLTPPLVITVQTDGPMNLDRPLAVRFPNLPDPATGQPLAPGAKTALVSFNHDLGEWEVQGPMTVTADGKFIETDPGYGIRQPGWHGWSPNSNGSSPGGPPPPLPECPPSPLSRARLMHGPDCPKPCPEDPQENFREKARCAWGSGFQAALKCILTRFACQLGCKLAPGGFVGGQLCQKACEEAFDSCEADIQKAKDCYQHADDCLIDRAGGVRLQAVRAVGRSQPPEVLALDTRFHEFISSLEAYVGLQKEIRTVLGSATTVEQLAAAQLEAMAALEARQHALLGGATSVDFIRAKMIALADAVDQLDRLVGVYRGEKAYYALQNLETGFVNRGQTGVGGAFSRMMTLASKPYRLTLLFPSSLDVAESEFMAAPPGLSFRIPPPVLVETPQLGDPFAIGTDEDADGLSDRAEFVLGTNPHLRDSDGDGLDDGTEFRQGANPLDGRPAATGILASAALPGTAQDLFAQNNTIVVATGDAGVSVLNVSDSRNPRLVAQVDTAGSARSVAGSGALVAVADDTAGLAVLEVLSGAVVSDRPQEADALGSGPSGARALRQVLVGGAAGAVAAAGGLAVVGTDNGVLTVVEMTTGLVAAQTSLGARVHDLAISGPVVFCLTGAELSALSLGDGRLRRVGAAGVSAFIPEGITGRKRLFVGGGYAYVASYPGYDVIDVRDPAAMVRVGTAVDAGPNSFKQIVLNGSGLGIAAVGVNPRENTTHDVWLYDVTDPSVTTRQLTTLLTPGVARALALYNGQAYVADGAEGLQVVNYLPFDTLGKPPTIRLSASFPLLPAELEEGAMAQLTAEVSDDVQVRNVEFYVDGQRETVDGCFPFEHQFTAPARTALRASFTVRARAFDTGGNSAWSDELTVRLLPDATRPRVVRVTPAALGIAGSIRTLSAVFSEPLNPTSIQPSSFRLLAAGADRWFGTADDREVLDGRLLYRDGPATLLFSREVALPPGLYRATVGGGLTDMVGNPLEAPFGWTFEATDTPDADQDGIPDDKEASFGFDPNRADSDGNGVPDGLEDRDGDGLSNALELLIGLNPFLRDTDGNGVADGDEDPDGDRLPNRREAAAGTNPLVADTDGDGFNDEAELTAGSDPLDAKSVPRGFVLSAALVDVVLPGLATGAGGFGTFATSPVVLDVLAPMTPPLVGQPSVDLLFPGLGEPGGSFGATWVAQPIIDVAPATPLSARTAPGPVTSTQPIVTVESP